MQELLRDTFPARLALKITNLGQPGANYTKHPKGAGFTIVAASNFLKESIANILTTGQMLVYRLGDDKFFVGIGGILENPDKSTPVLKSLWLPAVIIGQTEDGFKIVDVVLNLRTPEGKDYTKDLILVQAIRDMTRRLCGDGWVFCQLCPEPSFLIPHFQFIERSLMTADVLEGDPSYSTWCKTYGVVPHDPVNQSGKFFSLDCALGNGPVKEAAFAGPPTARPSMERTMTAAADF